MDPARHLTPRARRLGRVFASLILFALATPGIASAALTPERAAKIAKASQKAAEAELANPVATWQAVLQPGSAQWKAFLVTPGGPTLATVTIDDASGKVLGSHVPNPNTTVVKRRLTSARAAAIAIEARASAKVRAWIKRYESRGRKVTTRTDYDDYTKKWVRHWWSGGDEIARVQVADETGYVTDAWTGPQVLWSMARGGHGFGKRINDPEILLSFVLLFLIGMIDWRRLVSIRTLDALMLVSFAISLGFFNHGMVFWSVPTAYPPLLYFLVRLLLLGFGRGYRPAYRTRWSAFVLIAAAVFSLGFRAGLNYWESNVVDVGYAGVAGAARLLDGRVLYDQMPRQTDKPCGTRYSNGDYSAYEQKDGACETPVKDGDTYGPITYYSYLPATAALGWSGRWDALPPAHVTAFAFDLLAALGLAIAGLRIGGRQVAALALFFWATFPFTIYSLSSNSNDAIPAAFIAWALVFLTSPFLRGLMIGLATWAKFAPVLLIPLFVRATRSPRAARWSIGPSGRACILGVVVATLVAFVPLIVLAQDVGVLRTFWDRTFGWQLDRPSPFSVWDWGAYPGFPDLAAPQKALKAALVLFAAFLFIVPKRLDPARIAALGGALMVGFQLLLTHWSYLYIPWIVPFIAIALLAPYERTGEPEVEPEVESEPELNWIPREEASPDGPRPVAPTPTF